MTDSSRPWRPTPLIVASIALHTAALGYLLYEPSAWPLVVAALVVNHLILTSAGLWPRSTVLGSNWRSLPPASVERGEVAVTIDDGPDPAITPQVLDMLDRYNAKATFFCIGKRALEHREICQEIVRRGHAVENHSQHHLYRFAMLGLGGIDREIRLAQETITAITGQQPLFFRSPAGLRNPFLEPILARRNLQLVSWTRRGYDTRESCSTKVTKRLLQGIEAGDILLLHDGNAARAVNGEAIILQVLPRLLDAIKESKLNPVTLRDSLK